MKVITTEEHFMSAKVNQKYSEVFGKTATPAQQNMLKFVADYLKKDDSLTDLGAKRIAYMDKAGVDMEVISYGNNNPMDLPAAEAIPLCKAANDELATAVNAHPDRFAGLAALPVDDPEAAASELERSVNDLGLKGAILAGTFKGHFFDDARYFPIFAKAAELDVPIYIHPGTVNDKIVDYYYTGSWSPAVTRTISGYGFGWHADAGIHMLRLILSGLFDKLPNLKVVNGHWGELLPYYFDRLDEALPTKLTGLTRSISETYKAQVYVTPSGMFYKAPMQLCVNEIGADHLLWSMDYPYMKRDNTEKYLSDFGLNDADTEKIAHQNAEQIFHLN